MDKSFDELKNSTIQIPKIIKWDLYKFLFNLKSVYKKNVNKYTLTIKQDYLYEMWTSEIIKELCIPEEYHSKELFESWYIDPNELSKDDLYEMYNGHLSNEIITGLKIFNIEILYKDLKTINEKCLISSKEDDWQINLYWKMEYILFIDSIVIDNITNWFLLKYDKIKKEPIEEFYINIKEQYTESKRVDNIIYIDKIKTHNYDKIKNGLYVLYYQDNIKSFNINGKWFNIELLSTNQEENSRSINLDLNNIDITIWNWVIKNNGVPIADFTKDQKKIITEIWSKRNEGWISKENLLKVLNQNNEKTFNRAVWRLSKKIKDKWFDKSLIDIKLKKEWCVININNTKNKKL